MRGVFETEGAIFSILVTLFQISVALFLFPRLIDFSKPKSWQLFNILVYFSKDKGNFSRALFKDADQTLLDFSQRHFLFRGHLPSIKNQHLHFSLNQEKLKKTLSRKKSPTPHTLFKNLVVTEIKVTNPLFIYSKPNSVTNKKHPHLHSHLHPHPTP